ARSATAAWMTGYLRTLAPPNRRCPSLCRTQSRKRRGSRKEESEAPSKYRASRTTLQGLFHSGAVFSALEPLQAHIHRGSSVRANACVGVESREENLGIQGRSHV